jgi:hypothetical protein
MRAANKLSEMTWEYAKRKGDLEEKDYPT